MTDAARDADIIRTAAQLNRVDPLLTGSMLEFPDYGQLVMTGDLHGHQRNFDKIKRFCDLEHTPVRQIILHELIHEEPLPPKYEDLSARLVVEVAKWKCEFPDQIHFLQSNHELSQWQGSEISKGGRIVTHDFERGVETLYGKGYEKVLDAVLELIATYPLGGKTTNGIFLCHSLPGPYDVPKFDPTAFDLELKEQDYSENGSPYYLVWGRYQTPEVIDHMADVLDAKFFICGHQPQEMGYDILHDKMIILASDHNHGTFLPFDLRKDYTIEQLEKLIRPIASIA
jgi:hypothetical protein